MTQAYNKSAQGATIDVLAIGAHCKMLHDLAARANVPGKLVLAAYGEGIAPIVRHFEIGEYVAMTLAAMEIHTSTPGANIYSPYSIMRADLEPGLKGSESDIGCVLACVVDGDSDKGREAPQPPLPAAYIVETSAGNTQHVLPFDRPLLPGEAKPLCVALKRMTGGDCADDMSHVWRMPGTQNYPTRSKLARGRSPEPQLARISKAWDGSSFTSVDALREVLAAHWQEPERETTAAAPQGEYDVCPVKAEAFLTRLRDAGYFDAGPEARERYVAATKACAHDLGDEYRDIWERIVCWQGVRDDEGAAVDADEMDRRWRDCSSLKPGRKAKTFGSLIRDAQKVYGWTGINLRRDKSAAEMFDGIAPAGAASAPGGAALPQGATLGDFVAFLPMHQYVFVPTRELWPPVAVNAVVPPVQVPSLGKPMPASTWLDRNRPAHQMTWVPGEPMEIRDRLLKSGTWIERPGCVTFNNYRPPTIEPKAGDVSLWVNHIHRLYPDEAPHLIRWMAQRVQRPGEKINHAIVLGGAQGIGKDTILEPVKAAVGPWNFGETNPTQLMGRFTSFIKNTIVRVSETRDQGELDRVAFYEHSKTFCAAPPDVLRCDEKHVKEYDVLNVVGLILTTNGRDSLFLPSDDRRYFVAWNYDLTKEDFTPQYWQEFYTWLANGGNEAVAYYLLNLKLSKFDAKAPPPKTRGWRDIVRGSRATEDNEFADALDALNKPDAVTVEMLKLAAARASHGELQCWLSDRSNRRKIPHRFEEAGYVQIENPDAKDGQWVIDKRRQAVYARKELSLNAQLAAAVKLTQPPTPTGGA